MRVALITHRFPAASETFIAALFTRLLERGIDVHVVCAESPASDRALFPDLERHLGRVHVEMPARRSAALLMLPLTLVRCFARAPGRTLRYLVRGWRVYGPKVVWRAYRDAPFIVLGPDIVHFQFGNFARGRERLGSLLDCALVTSFQGADLNYAGLEAGPGYYADVWRHADAIHFLGEDLKRRATTRGYVPDERSMVIRPGVDTSVFAPRPREPVDGRPVRILSVGRLHWKKGYEYALASVRDIAGRGIACEYRIIGDGEFRDAVEHAVVELGLEETVDLLGVLSLDRVREEMQRADVLLHAAVSEGFCYVAVEAQAMELPVVTSDADGLPENVADGVSGFVVGRRDARALADRVESIARDEDLRVRLGRAGRERARTTFAPEQQIDGFVRLYELARKMRASQRAADVAP